MFVKNDGRIFNFCGSKCQKNWNMGREGIKTKWTDTFRKGKVQTEKKTAEKKQEKKTEVKKQEKK